MSVALVVILECVALCAEPSSASCCSYDDYDGGCPDGYEYCPVDVGVCMRKSCNCDYVDKCQHEDDLSWNSAIVKICVGVGGGLFCVVILGGCCLLIYHIYSRNRSRRAENTPLLSAPPTPPRVTSAVVFPKGSESSGGEMVTPPYPTSSLQPPPYPSFTDDSDDKN